MSNEDLISVDYEIFGKVQGVFFRKYTQRERVLFYGVRHVKSLCFYSSPERTNQTLALHTAQGKKLGLVGWVQNTSAGTVQGQLQGPRSKVKEMQEWLKSTGSPKSHITKAEFKNEKTVDSLDHSSFNIVK